MARRRRIPTKEEEILWAETIRDVEPGEDQHPDVSALNTEPASKSDGPPISKPASKPTSKSIPESGQQQHSDPVPDLAAPPGLNQARNLTSRATEDEAVLWAETTKDVEPISATVPVISDPSAKSPTPQRGIGATSAMAKPVRGLRPKIPAVINPFRIGDQANRAPTLPSAASLKRARAGTEHPPKNSPNMDRRNYQRLLKGQMKIDGVLDLHGMSVEQAHRRLQAFIKRCHQSGHRQILVITGKGRHERIDEFNRPRTGVLKSNVPEWLAEASMSALVLEVTPASKKDGGSGAYYVRLRRQRD